jgi:membrane-bound lytic murein transglycosylase B
VASRRVRRRRRAVVLVALAAGLAVTVSVAVSSCQSRADRADDRLVAPRAVPLPTAVDPEAEASALAPDPSWVASTSRATGIPARALQAYAAAALMIDREQPGCGVGWNTLAGIGSVETAHGTHGGAVLGANGYPDPPIRGIPLDGTSTARIPDSDGGRWDGDTEWDRAVGPMQFIPQTWEQWGADANGDGIADPNSIDDAALAAARYLCAEGTVASVDGWRSAVFRYNNLDTYVNEVAARADRFALSAAG